jgi:hypothetical protein
MRAEIGFARLGEPCQFSRVAADEAMKRYGFAYHAKSDKRMPVIGVDKL